jgi:2,5-diketo-D-gluconate reductase A
MPRLGLGTWPMDDGEAERTIPLAAELGYRLFDTAHAYGNETGVGRGLRASGLPREELFVTTKLNGEWHDELEAQEACRRSLDKLGLDCVDLYLIHWPLPRQNRYVDAWRGLVRLREEGLARAIGVSNFKPAHIDRLLAETGVVPDVNQIQLDPTLTRDGPRAYHARHGIVTESWSPLGQGGGFLADPTIGSIARRYGKTPAQVVLRWHLELDLVTIPKSSNPERLRENIDVFDFVLAPEEVAAISALDRGEEAAYDSDVVGH